MIKHSVLTNNIFVINNYEASEFRSMLHKENLSINELNCLRNLINEKDNNVKHFIDIVQEFIDDKIESINLKIA